MTHSKTHSNRKQINDYLAEFITPERRKRMDSVLQERQRYLTVVLEDIYQPHNTSAVLRSCDAFGVQYLHIIENSNRFSINPDVELGSAQWLSIRRYREQENNSRRALTSLKEAGYRLIAAAPEKKQRSLEELDVFAGPMALMFGTEISGLSEEALELADECFSIPMYGFVESFNISVAVAITLWSLNSRIRSTDIDWRLSEPEKESIRAAWLHASVKNAPLVEKEFHTLHG